MTRFMIARGNCRTVQKYPTKVAENPKKEVGMIFAVL